MSAWIVKGRPSRNDLARMLAPGQENRWVTRRPPREWAAGDLVFVWKGAPAPCAVGLAEIVKVAARNGNADAFFRLRYTTSYLATPIGIDQLRRDRVFRNASFLKSGAGGTVFAVTPAQSRHLLFLVRRANPAAPGIARPPRRVNAHSSPDIALSIRQPWAEMIMSGTKTIEVRSIRTHKLGRVHVYASKTRNSWDEEVVREHKLDHASLRRGVLVGTIEITGCRQVRASDSKAAGFRIRRGDPSYGWHLAKPIRARRLRAPTGQPSPTFFHPF